MSAYVQFADTAKSFGPVEVVRKTNLGLERNSLVVFLGPSGCGKTTLMRMVGGLDQPSSGSILLGGDVVAVAHAEGDVAFDRQPRERRIGLEN
ncbi:MAG: ABC transporter ATP-binding protein, partial [Mesorhizobium sp.]